MVSVCSPGWTQTLRFKVSTTMPPTSIVGMSPELNLNVCLHVIILLQPILVSTAAILSSPKETLDKCLSVVPTSIASIC